MTKMQNTEDERDRRVATINALARIPVATQQIGPSAHRHLFIGKRVCFVGKIAYSFD